jgi:sugar O-acyltransferase (sialic acid O-acetyltransferase NeuD family)
MQQLVILGTGGHAMVLTEIIQRSDQYQLIGFITPDSKIKEKQIKHFPILGSDDDLPMLFKKGIKHAIVGIGSIGDNGPRKNLYQRIINIGFSPVGIVHPKAFISSTTKLGKGVVIMANAVVNSNVSIGDNVIVNSGAIIEHDCIIGDHVHVASGSCLAGGVQVGSESHIGMGAKVIQCLQIGKNAIVGAGAVVIRDVPDGVTVVGCPAKVLQHKD